jgi:DNA-binding MarR family transcriptional regulator
MQLLWAVAHGLERASKRMKSEVGVTGPQRLVLRVVALFPGLSAGELAGILHVHPSTLTGVLRRLESQGLLVRAEDSVDRRRVALRLTPAGSRVNETRRGTVELAVARTLDRVGAADRTAAKRVLGRLARRLAAAGGRAARSPRRTTERVRPRKAGPRA